jgi:DNA-binding NarL/FixJ family response regulator
MPYPPHVPDGAPASPEPDARVRGARVVVGLRELLVADGFSRFLRAGGFEVVGCCGDLDQLLDTVRRCAPDLVIMSPQVDTADGRSRSLGRLREVAPTTRTVVLTREVDAPLAHALVRYSINGVVTLATRPTDALAMLRQVMAGQLVYPRAVLGHLGGDSGPSGLSERQTQVLGLLALGKSNDEIAERLFISRNTVKFHLREIYGRLGVRNRVEAARRIQRPGS